MKLAAACIGLLLSLLLRPPSLSARELPVESFFSESQFQDPQLSPDGRSVALITAGKVESSVLVVDLETGKRQPMRGGAVFGLHWATNERLLLEEGNVFLGGLVAINRDGSNLKQLLKPILLQRGGAPCFERVRVLSIPKPANDWVLVESLKFWLGSRRPEATVRRLNFQTGESSLEAKNPGGVVSWVADERGCVRAGISVEKKTTKILYRQNNTAPWQVISESPLLERDILPVGVDPASDMLYVMAHAGRDTAGLYKFDPAKKAIAAPVWENPDFHLCGILPGFKRGGEVRGIIHEEERFHTEWLSDPWRRLQARADGALPDRVNLLVSSSDDGLRHLFLSGSDRCPGEYYFTDSRTNSLIMFGKVSAQLNPDEMAGMRPVEYRARDGLLIHGYLTLPQGGSNNLPMITMVHGGPWARVHWDFDPEVQFLANRGYAVLQMNFRGSAGYGVRFLKAGFKEWGRKIQDDITDGVKWAVAQGVADPNRIGIFGASYGGYSALMGLITTPELYRCAVCYAGPTDISEALKRSYAWRPKTARFVDRVMIGDYREDEEELDAVSPIKLVDKIRAPVLLAYGGHDPIVDLKQGEQLAKAMQKAKKPHELIVEPMEGHGFLRQTNRVNLCRKVEEFLKKNL